MMYKKSNRFKAKAKPRKELQVNRAGIPMENDRPPKPIPLDRRD